MRKALRAALLAGAALGLIAAPAPAQAGAGALAGRVTDAERDTALAGATIIITGTLYRATTDAAGRYDLVDLPAGRYPIRILLLGWEPDERDTVEIRAGQTARFDAALHHAAVELPGVTVTASRLARPLGQGTASEAVVTRRDVLARSAIHIDDVLPFVQGVSVNHGDLDIRGATGIAAGVGSRVLVLLDGHPMLTADGGEIDFAQLPLLDLDRVEVVKGAYSALYGSNALGGVVNLITTPIDSAPRSIVDLHYGAYDMPPEAHFTDHTQTFRGFAVQHSRFVGPVGARVAVARDVSDGYTEDGRANDWLLRAKLQLAPESAHPASLYALWSWEDDGNFFTGQPDDIYAVPDSARDDHAKSQKLSIGGTVVPLAGASYQLRVSPYFEHDYTRNYYAGNGDHHRAIKLGTDAQLSTVVARRHTVVVGGEGAHTRVSANILGTPTLDDGGAYVQDESPLGARATASVGARVDAHRASGSPTEVTLNPKAGIAVRASPGVSTRISLARGYRAPSAIEQFVRATQDGARVIPNPTLHGETAWSAEIGTTATLGRRLWLDAALFRSAYRGLIGPAAVPESVFVFQFRNVSRARVQGLDAGTKVALVPDRLDLQLTYVYLDTRDDSTGRPLPYRSRHNLTTTLDALGGLAAVDVRFRSRVQQVLAYPLDPRGGITVVDLRLGYRVLGTALQAKISNLFQSRYVDVLERTPGAPRSFLLTAIRFF